MKVWSMIASALSSDDFTTLMEPFGPFEAAPRLAVAVSGGADSLALAVLAAEWARARGGEVVALTVDHGLRPGSAAEAAQTREWLAALGISHHILRWTGPKPSADLQAQARDARYGLLGEFCQSAGILHLLLAHHREDQAETLLLRLGRGSGLDGLAAMAPERTTRWGRLVRPLLDIPRQRLRATLESRGQSWIEDPSNRNLDFARVRLRRLMPDLAAEGLDPTRLAATAKRLGRARAALETALAEAAARYVELASAGYAFCRAPVFFRLPEEIGLRLLARLILVVGGGVHGPRLERLERLYGQIRAGLATARTLGGCSVVPWEDGMIVCREPARMAPPVALLPGEAVLWDGRFLAELAPHGPSGLFLGGLGAVGWRRLCRMSARDRLHSLPSCVRPTLPALFDEDGVSAVPHLGYNPNGVMAGLRRLDVAPGWTLTAIDPRLVRT
jgi:tRNA(Ile)-lysidine synthase